MKNKFFVTSCRFHVNNKRKLLVTGYFRRNQMGKNKLIILLGQECLPSKIEEHEFLNGSMRNSSGMPITKQYYLWITLPDTWREEKGIRIIECEEGNRKQVCYLPINKIEKKLQELPCAIDKTEIGQGCFWLRGWYVNKGDVEMNFQDQGERNLEMHIEKIRRPDICKKFPECTEDEVVGFIATCESKKIVPRKVVIHIVSVENASKKICILQPTNIEKIFSKSILVIQKVKLYYQKNGIQAVVKRIWDKITNRTEISYKEWYRRNRPSFRNLKKQKNEKFEYLPLISIFIFTGKASQTDIYKTHKALRKQSYPRWKAYVFEEERALMNEKQGEWFAFVSAGDILSPDALYESVKLMNIHRDAEVIYSDEDKIDFHGKNHSEPNFKSDFNKDMLCSMNYIGDFFLVSGKLYQRVGELNIELGAAARYDYLLRCIEKTEKIFHIPKILYSKKISPQKRTEFEEIFKQAIQHYYNRTGVQAQVVGTEHLGVYRSKYELVYEPLVSVIIPNKDHIEDLNKCLRSLFETNVYQNLECIVVENNSMEEDTFVYYKQIMEEFPKVKVVYWSGTGFNYPAINMYGVEEAKGEYLLFLNNDTEIINEDCIKELLGYCMRKDVGAVGARLYYEDRSIQHAGVIVGLGGVAAHAFVDMPGDNPGYKYRIVVTQDYSAVTAACMMVKRSVFEEVGGFDTNYAVAFNDVDLCLKIREAGYLIVYNPYAELIHYESKSRGYEDTPEKIARFQSEIERFHKRWSKILENGDPYYNLNLTLDKTDFSMSVVPRVKG